MRTHAFHRFVLAAAIVLAASTIAYAQGGITAPLAGTVVDTSGAVIPGADVVVKHNATGTVHTAVTNAQGGFNIPAVVPGKYTVTVSLSGFKTVVLNDVEVNAGVPASVRAVLAIGELAETITVEAASSLVQTQTSAVSTTVRVEQITNVPVTSRNVLDFVPFLPGVNTPGGNRDSTVNGLPQSTINITMDGINIQDNTLKSTDGFFTIVQPRLDAIEEVTFTTTAQGAEASGQGAVQLRFVTRSGTNQFLGSAYHYYRNDRLNENTWFNKRNGVAKPELLQNQPGFRVGGPMVLPGLWDGHDKGFFFVNYEEQRTPQDVTRKRRIMSPLAQAGIFQYGGNRQVDLLALAARNGHVATADSIIAKLLSDIRAATGTTGSVSPGTDPNLQEFDYNVAQSSLNRFPTARVDFNLTEKHRLMASYNRHTFSSNPDTLNNRDPLFPGFPATGTQTSKRILFSSSLRSTLGRNLVNELRGGGSGAPVFFFKELASEMWSGSSANQSGFQLNLSCFPGGATGGACPTGFLGSANNITSASNTPGPSSRNAYTYLMEDTVSWMKGSHSIGLGTSFSQTTIWLRNQTLVPTVNFGLVSADPALNMFTPANLPGASSSDLAKAQRLYAVLTGRVESVLANARLDEDGNYVFLGPATQRARMREWGFYVQDSWRLRPDMTLNAGLRYEVQLPFVALNSSYSTATVADVCGVSGVGADGRCNLFQPGVLTGKTPEFQNLAEGQKPYETDWNNWAPSVGLNWTPAAESGFLRTLLGQPGDSAISGGFSTAYNREGMSNFTNIFGANPGILITADRSQGIGNLGTAPLLLRESGRLGPPPFPERPVFPLRDVVTEDVNIFDPNLDVPYTQSWSVGFQRALGRSMSMDVRYVGNRHRQAWTEFDFNEINITENGFLNEFRLAQANLQAHVGAGCGAASNPCSFAYRGPGTGTSPLPIFLAYFNGLPASEAGNAASYTSTQFRNSALFLTPLATFNPQPYVAANRLDDDRTRRENAVRAGLPANFLVANPDLLGGAEMTTNADSTSYHSLQLQLRRRISNGLDFQTSYVFGNTRQNEFLSFRRAFRKSPDTGGEGEVTHAWKAVWLYELPFGRGQRWGSNAGAVLNRLIGGWHLNGTARVQTGRLIDFGNVRMVGFDEKDLRKMFKLRIDGNRRVFMLPDDVIDNTIKAFNVSATSSTGFGPGGPPSGPHFAPANGPNCVEVDFDGDGQLDDVFGDCAPGSLVRRGPVFKNFDFGLLKSVPIYGRVKAEFRFEVLNAFNNVNFVPLAGVGSTTATGFELTGLTGANTARLVQLVSRVSW